MKIKVNQRKTQTTNQKGEKKAKGICSANPIENEIKFKIKIKIKKQKEPTSNSIEVVRFYWVV